MTAQVIPIRSLEEAVAAIERKFEEDKRSKDRRYSIRCSVGDMLIKLRHRIEAGEAGADVEWWEWYGAHFTRTRRDAEKVMRLASGGASAEMWEQEKTKAREGMARLRAGRKSAANNDDVSRDQVDQILQSILSLNHDQQQQLLAQLREHLTW